MEIFVQLWKGRWTHEQNGDWLFLKVREKFNRTKLENWFSELVSEITLINDEILKLENEILTRNFIIERDIIIRRNLIPWMETFFAYSSRMDQWKRFTQVKSAKSTVTPKTKQVQASRTALSENNRTDLTFVQQKPDKQLVSKTSVGSIANGMVNLNLGSNVKEKKKASQAIPIVKPCPNYRQQNLSINLGKNQTTKMASIKNNTIDVSKSFDFKPHWYNKSKVVNSKPMGRFNSVSSFRSTQFTTNIFRQTSYSSESKDWRNDSVNKS